jgi:hypothetical protein
MPADSAPVDPPKGVPDDALDRLFRGPLEQFTPQRNALSKALRADGKAKAAEWVKGLRKPSRGAWLVNQLSVRKAEEVRELLALGQQLRAAQEEMLTGATDRERLRETARRERETIESLLRTAEAIGREHGVGSQILTKVGETLQAASNDPDVARAVERGRLTKETRAASVGLLGAGPAAPTRGKKKDRADGKRRAREQRAKRRKEAERKLVAAERKLDRERAALERARERVTDAEHRVHEAELGANAARRALEDT